MYTDQDSMIAKRGVVVEDFFWEEQTRMISVQAGSFIQISLKR
jgi:hypothetical protein